MYDVTYLCIYTAFVTFFYESKVSIGKSMVLMHYKVFVMLLLSLISLYKISVEREEVEFHFFSVDINSFYSVICFFILDIPIIIDDIDDFYSYFEESGDTNIWRCFIRHLKSSLTPDYLLYLFLSSFSEEVIFRCYYINFLKGYERTDFYCVVVTSILYTISRIYYYFMSPLLFSNYHSYLVRKTIIYMVKSFLYSIYTCTLFVKSRTFFSVYFISVLFRYGDRTSYYSLIRMSRNLKLLLTQIAIFLSLIYTPCCFLMLVS